MSGVGWRDRGFGFMRGANFEFVISFSGDLQVGKMVRESRLGVGLGVGVSDVPGECDCWVLSITTGPVCGKDCARAGVCGGVGFPSLGVRIYSP